MSEGESVALLHRYAGGGNLTPAEIAAVGLPDAHAMARRVTSDTYAHALSHYAEVYHYGERNLKKLIAVGRNCMPPDLPPLDSPIDMPSWWARHMKQKCPPRLLAAAQPGEPPSGPKVPKAGESAPPPNAPSTTPAATDPIGGRNLADVPTDGSYSAKLDRADYAEQTAYRYWHEALNAKPYDAGAEEQRRRAYERAAEIARKMHLNKDEGLASDEEWVRFSEFETLVSEHLNVVNQSLRSSPVRVATKMALPAELLRRLGEAWNIELDRVFDYLSRIDYKHVLKTRAQDSDTPLELDAA